MHPLRTVRPDVGLGGGVSHRVIADPRGQVDIECAGIDDAICVHQAPFGQLQNGKKRGPSEGGGGMEHTPVWRGKKSRALHQHLQQSQECPLFEHTRKSRQNTFGFFQNALIRGCNNLCVYNTHGSADGPGIDRTN